MKISLLFVFFCFIRKLVLVSAEKSGVIDLSITDHGDFPFIRKMASGRKLLSTNGGMIIDIKCLIYIYRGRLILESSPVEDLKVDTRIPGFLFIHFKEPSLPHGTILKYRVKITSTKIHICSMVKIYLFISI